MGLGDGVNDPSRRGAVDATDEDIAIEGGFNTLFVQSVLEAMTGCANVELAEFSIYENQSGAVGFLSGTITAHSSGEKHPLTDHRSP
jgi:hypothetical protein